MEGEERGSQKKIQRSSVWGRFLVWEGKKISRKSKSSPPRVRANVCFFSLALSLPLSLPPQTLRLSLLSLYPFLPSTNSSSFPPPPLLSSSRCSRHSFLLYLSLSNFVEKKKAIVEKAEHFFLFSSPLPLLFLFLSFLLPSRQTTRHTNTLLTGTVRTETVCLTRRTTTREDTT